MGIERGDEQVEVTFVLNGARHGATLKRRQIVHEGFHAALPVELTAGHRLTFRTPDGAEVFADNFIADLQDRFHATELLTTAVPIPESAGPWRNIGFDHLAITIKDRPGARDFFRDVLRMAVMRDDEHLTVLATGPTALFLFDAGQQAPLSNGQPSSWHHLGFVVDDLEAAYAHLQAHRERLLSDFTLLERNERWSLYFFYRNGEVTFMIQLSRIKEAERGFAGTEREDFPTFLYDYASRPYGLQWDEDGALIGRTGERA